MHQTVNLDYKSSTLLGPAKINKMEYGAAVGVAVRLSLGIFSWIRPPDIPPIKKQKVK